MKEDLVLVLGAGGAKGLAHIGVLKAMEDKGLKPTRIIGTSMGAVIGALYAKGYSAREIENIAYEFKLTKFMDVYGLKKGFLQGAKIEAFLKSKLCENFEELEIPLLVNAVDINTGEEVVFESGPLIEPIRASFSIPGIFTSKKINGRELVDAGFTIPVGINHIPRAKEVIIVDVTYSSLDRLEGYNPFSALKQALLISQRHSADRLYDLYLHKNKSEAVYYIKPDLRKWDIYEFNHSREIIRQGEVEARKQL